MAQELFADNATGVVSAGGTTAPAVGTSETWTISSVTGTWPSASNTSVPKSWFRIVDPASPAEWMLVTNITGTGPYTATVIRGIEGTPVAHSPGFTVQAVVTSGWLNGIDSRYGAVNVKQMFDVKGDGRQVTDGAMSTGTPTTLTCATSTPFTPADVGKSILVQAATSAPMRLAGRIASVQSATQATLTVPAAVAAAGLTMVIDGIRTVTDAVTTNNSAVVTSATAAFSAANDVGKAVYINGANTVALNTTIAAYISASQVTLNASATRTCTGSLVTWGTDDTAAIINAFTWAGSAGSYSSLYFPASMYLAKPSHLGVSAMNIPSYTRVFGDGWDTIIRSTGAEDPATLSRELWGINTGTGGTTNPANNVSNVLIENIQFQGTQIEEGFQENGSNLLSLNAASDVTVRGCKFYNSRSDGIYVGSSTAANTERHNERIHVDHCYFDGVANQCRNAISVIDGTVIDIEHCDFTGWANELMPGAIDSEPNDYTFVRLRDIRIADCSFTMIGGNQAVASMYLNTPADWYSSSHKGWTFEDNFVYNCLSSTLGILLLNPNYPSDVTPRLDAIIQNNVFRGNSADNTGLAYVAEFEGVRGVRFAGNFVDVTQFGMILGSNYKCRDIEISGNTFKDVSGQGGKAIEIARCDQLKIDNNIFDHVSPVGAGGYITRFINANASLATPAGVVATPSSTGGTLTSAHGAYGYRVAAYLDDGSTTVASTEVTATIASGSAGSITVSWNPVYGAKGYNVYGRTVAGELLMTPAGIPQPSSAVASVSFLDTGSVTPSGALPAASSTNGHSQTVTFTNNIVRQGAANNTGNISGLVAGHVTQPNTLAYQDNQIPGNAALPIAPFTARSTSYTITTSPLTVDASLVPDLGTVVMNTSTASAAGALTVSNGVIGQVITFQFVIGTINFTYAFAANMKFSSTWNGGAITNPPVHTLTAGKSDFFTFRFDGTNWNEISRSQNVG